MSTSALVQNLLRHIVAAITGCLLAGAANAAYFQQAEVHQDTTHPQSYERLMGDSEFALQQAIHAQNWKKTQGSVRLGYIDAPTWLRYQLPPNDARRVFKISNAWLLKFDLHLVRRNKVIASYSTGSARPFRHRPIAATDFAFDIPADTEYVYIYDYGLSAANYPVSLQSPAVFAAANARSHTFHGLYYGAILFMALYNLALFWGTRDKTYLLYTLYATGLSAFLSTTDGTSAMFFWPELPQLQLVAIGLFWIAAFGFLIEFTNRFLNLPPRTVLLHRVLQGVIVLVGLVAAFAPSPAAYTLQTLVSGLVLATLVFVGARASMSGSASARLFLVANGALALGSIAHISMLLGWLHSTPLVHHAIHLGSFVELSLFAWGLVLRVRNSETARSDALEESRELQRRNRELSTARTLAEEHRQLQKALQQAQKLKTIGQMAGGFAHDFNNILASILGFAELALTPEAHRNRAKLNRYLNEIHRSGQRGASLVQQLLLYSRNSHSQPQRINLAQALQQLHELVRGSLPATIDLTTQSPPSALFVRSDPEQLQQVLVNLCLNAAEATDNRGRVSVSTELVEVAELSCSSCLNRFSGEFVAIKVSDSGAGIQGNASQLFTPFYTTKDIGSGTGLGLSVVHGITHENGGHLHASNHTEGGARFVVYLPLMAHEAAIEQPSVSQRQRILIIEDDPSVAAYLTTLLEAEDFVPTIKRLPTQALETFVADPNAFDLVITDHLMPQGTGVELAEDIHALRPELPVILTTGNPNNVSRADLDSAYIQAVFQKPLNSEHLLAKIRGLLAG